MQVLDNFWKDSRCFRMADLKVGGGGGGEFSRGVGGAGPYPGGFKGFLF